MDFILACISSCAAYDAFKETADVKVCCMQDRPNGNILMDVAGHISHTNLSFILGTPSDGLKFEAAPFELT